MQVQPTARQEVVDAAEEATRKADAPSFSPAKFIAFPDGLERHC